MWPSVVDVMLSVLTPKTDAGWRPIGVPHPSLVRSRARVCSQTAKKWGARAPRSHFHDGAETGAQRAAPFCSCRAEMLVFTGKVLCRVFSTCLTSLRGFRVRLSRAAGRWFAPESPGVTKS